MRTIVRHEGAERRPHVEADNSMQLSCSTDEGRPLEIGLQEQIPNHLWRLWSKATVVSADGKGPATTGSGVRQEEDCEGTTVEVSKAI